MSDIIHLLPDSVANQIAAGEVIQRPASIIKELVENSLDAGATHIQVVIEDAGKSLVQVIDNGCGMSATDARLSFERHATSKIQQATDLFALRTMGFRGEALASIAAVAQVELRTRRKEDELGTSIQIEGSKLINQEPISCPVGANFAVKNLFFNIPARRKFLKSNQTELTNILAEYERISLAHPEVEFTMHSGSSVMMNLPSGNFRQRIIGIFGRKIDSRLVPIQADTTLAKISGFVGMPSAAKKKNAHQYLFVNGRYMRHPYFVKAIITAYERLIPEGQQIPFFIKFDVDPARIDVNIHPTKTEIKFEDDAAIFQILLAAVREALGKFGAVPALDFDTEGKPDIPGLQERMQSPIIPPQIHVDTSYNPFSSEYEQSKINAKTKPISDRYIPTATNKSNMDWQQAYDCALNNGSENHENDNEKTYIHKNEDAQKENLLYDILPSNEKTEWMETVGTDFLQYHGRYIITPLQTGLALIDQHKAHTRILYERFMRQIENRQTPSQRLLLPEIITLSPSEESCFVQIIPQLQQVGFDFSPLGSGSYSILAAPMGAEGISPLNLVSSILSDAITGQAHASETVGHLIAQSLADKMAMPIGQALNKAEITELIEQLFTCHTPNLTPNGQPTLIIIHPEKMF